MQEGARGYWKVAVKYLVLIALSLACAGQHTPRSIRENMLACVDKFGPPPKLPTVCTCVEDAATLCRKYGYWVTCAWQEDKNDLIAPDLRHDWWTVGMCLERYKQ